MEKLEFIKMMLNNRYLSINDKKRLLSLATREIETINNAVGDEEHSQQSLQSVDKKFLQPHKPKDTATFLSLFDNPNGFKYLTHDFAPDMTDEERNYENFMKRTRELFDKEAKSKKIPQTLWKLMDTILNGGEDDKGVKTWLSCDETPQRENYACDEWVEWAMNNPHLHLLANGDFARTINLFRNTIRVVRPALRDIVDEIPAELGLEIIPQGLERADFYTYVLYLKKGINRILKDISQRKNDHPQINISFKSDYDDDDFVKKIIKITQVGAIAHDFEGAKKRFEDVGENGKSAGAFNDIKKHFVGYCNWSTEAMWDGQPLRWNLLDDTDRPDVEKLGDAQIEGFTHILTYYYK